MSEIPKEEQQALTLDSYRKVLAELKQSEETAHFKRTDPEGVMGDSRDYFEKVDSLHRKLGYSSASEWFAGLDIRERIENLDTDDLLNLSIQVNELANDAPRLVPQNADGDVIAAMNNKLTTLKGFIDLEKRKRKL